jgi:hypothetical protein
MWFIKAYLKWQRKRVGLVRGREVIFVLPS